MSSMTFVSFAIFSLVHFVFDGLYKATVPMRKFQNLDKNEVPLTKNLSLDTIDDLLQDPKEEDPEEEV